VAVSSLYEIATPVTAMNRHRDELRLPAHATAYEAWAMLQLGHREEAARLARKALLELVTTPVAFTIWVRDHFDGRPDKWVALMRLRP
jgi:hypothetical protein